MTELILGTRKGLFVLEGEPSGPFEVRARAFAGETVDNARRDPRSGRIFATVTSPFYGPKIFYTERPVSEWVQPAGTPSFPPEQAVPDWEQASGVELPRGGEAALKRIWVIEPGEEDGVVFAGGDPGVLFKSADGGTSFELNEALWNEPTRPGWQPGGGGLCLHSIVTWPGEPDRLAIGISAAGVWLTEDGGKSWRQGNNGLKARYVPEEAPEDQIALCVHRIQRPAARPQRLFLQFHGGVYRSDDAGSSWTEIGDGLPSDFGFPLAVDPADPDAAYVIPLTADMDRVTPGQRVRVYETRDAGSTWTARGDGLPAEHAYLTILREAFDWTGSGASLGARKPLLMQKLGDLDGVGGGSLAQVVADHPQVEIALAAGPGVVAEPSNEDLIAVGSLDRGWVAVARGVVDHNHALGLAQELAGPLQR
jgi:hypothetical protein